MSDVDDILDSLVPDPPVQPSRPAPALAPVKTGQFAAGTSRRTLLELAAVAVVTFSLAVGLTAWWLGPRDGKPSPGDVDTRFVAVGKAYLGDLGEAYGSAWEDGAKVLDAGQPIGMALDTTAKAWEANRKAAFNRRITPELSKVVEQGKDEKSVTSEDRAALAKAYRGLAKGLGGGR